jgi:hypothetical protein
MAIQTQTNVRVLYFNRQKIYKKEGDLSVGHQKMSSK